MPLEWVCKTGPLLVLWRAFWHISTFVLRRLHIFLFVMEQVSWKPTTCSHRMELIYDYVETRDVVTRTECSREKESYDRTPRYTGYSHSVQWRADRLRVQIFSAGSRQGDLKSNFRLSGNFVPVGQFFSGKPLNFCK